MGLRVTLIVIIKSFVDFFLVDCDRPRAEDLQNVLFCVTNTPKYIQFTMKDKQRAAARPHTQEEVNLCNVLLDKWFQ